MSLVSEGVEGFKILKVGPLYLKGWYYFITWILDVEARAIPMVKGPFFPKRWRGSIFLRLGLTWLVHPLFENLLGPRAGPWKVKKWFEPFGSQWSKRLCHPTQLISRFGFFFKQRFTTCSVAFFIK